MFVQIIGVIFGGMGSEFEKRWFESGRGFDSLKGNKKRRE